MSYIIINGVESDAIRGLLIQKLPPITKPRMRAQINEVDGVDGDSMVKLGYAAYDKEILIGLYGCYDVDEIVSFFAESGTITFSDEPEKYYRYQLVEQIDFERLLRFRQATVRVHVQPYKYPVHENAVTLVSGTQLKVVNYGNVEALPTITLTGSGAIELSVNGKHAVDIDLDTGQSITISVSEQDAFYDGVLLNRRCSGDYLDLSLKPGVNLISWSGTVTAMTVTDYTRWL